MAHQPIVSYKTKVEINDGTSQAWVAVDGLISVELPEKGFEWIDVTPLDVADGVMKWKPKGFYDGGMGKLSVYYSSTNIARFVAIEGKEYQTMTGPVATKLRLTPKDADGSGDGLATIHTVEVIFASPGPRTFDKSSEAPKFDVSFKVNSAITLSDATNGSGTP